MLQRRLDGDWFMVDAAEIRTREKQSLGKCTVWRLHLERTKFLVEALVLVPAIGQGITRPPLAGFTG